MEITGENFCPVHFVMVKVWLLYSLIVTILLLFEILIDNEAPQMLVTIRNLNRYGRLLKNQKESSCISALLISKSLFTHFYIISTCFTTLLLGLLASGNSICDLIFEDMLYTAIPSMRCFNRPLLTNKTVILLALLMSFSKGFRRSYECLYVTKFLKDSKINLIQYFVGCTFYILEPLTIMFLAIPVHDLSWGKINTVEICALLLCVLFSFMQYYIVSLMRKLRNGKDKQYSIPQNFLFKYISCPHYFMEALIYICVWAVLNFNALYFYVIVWVFTCHMNMAYCSHRWLVNNFTNYPTHRKRLIPFVW